MSRKEYYDSLFESNGREINNNVIIGKWRNLFYKLCNKRKSNVNMIPKKDWGLSEEDVKINAIKVLKTID